MAVMADHLVSQVCGKAKHSEGARGMPGTALQGLMLLGEQSRYSGLPFPEPAEVGVSNGAHLESMLKMWP